MSGAPPRVAVIVPAYNGERLLPHALESVFAQTYQDWEVVVVDDASTDGTAALAESFARRAPERFTVVRLNQNVGVGGARTAGVERSGGGELLCLLDQDDLWDERYLEQSVAAFDRTLAAGRSVGIVSSNALILTEDGVSEETYWDRNGWVEPVDLDAMIRHNYLMARSLFFRGAFEDAGGEFARDCGGSDDYDLWLRILEAGYEAIGIREPLVTYRVHADSFSHDSVAMSEGKIVAYRRALERGALTRSRRRVVRARIRHFKAMRLRALFRRAVAERRPARAALLGIRAAPHGLVAFLQDPRRWGEWGRDLCRAAGRLRLSRRLGP